MTNHSARFRLVAALFAALFARSGEAAEGAGGRLSGWVEDTRGVPVAGAVISLFGNGIRGGGLITFSDSSGRFFLPSLPPGSYTLRALGSNHFPAPARQVTVPVSREALFTVSLTPLDEAALQQQPRPSEQKEAQAESAATRELRWLVRHKRRSVLEEREAGPATAEEEPVTGDLLQRGAPWVSELGGTVEVMASPAVLGLDRDSLTADTLPLSFSVLRLQGRLAESGRWSLGGLVSESESTAWRMAAEFVLEPGGGHEIEVGSGYGTRLLRPLVPSDSQGRLDNRTVGAVFARDRWTLNDRLTASVGLRHSYIGFLEDRNHLDRSAALELSADGGARIRGSFSSKTLVPGGDLLTLSTLGSAPALAFALIDHGLRPERMTRYELAVNRAYGATTLGAHTFHEGVKDPLVNVFEGPRASRSLRILNGQKGSARGMGFTVGRRFGDCVTGSLSYTYGRSWRDGRDVKPAPGRDLVLVSYGEADFHDIVTRLETFIGWSDTRVAAFYRINTLNPESDDPGANASLTNSRFDVQLSQGLPFLGPLTRAEWELLLAVRNLFYETGEGGILDEVTVLNPPKRVMGGISVRF